MGLPEPVVLSEREGKLALLRINSLPRRNALSREVLAELKVALSTLSRSQEIGALIIGSAIEGTFVSGGDVRELRDLASAEEGLNLARSFHEVFQLVEGFRCPVVATINGYTLGAGAELAVAADIRVAADTALLSFAQVLRGILPGFCGGQRLIRLVGSGHAKRLILTGEMVTAQEALRLGLVEFVVPPAELWSKAKELGRTLASKPGNGVALAKQALNFSSQSRLKTGCAYEAELFGRACSSVWNGG